MVADALMKEANFQLCEHTVKGERPTLERDDQLVG